MTVTTLLNLTYLDPRMRQFVALIEKKRIVDHEYPPRGFPFGDPRWSFQTTSDPLIGRVRGLFKSPEWMVAVTCREIALAGSDYFLFGATLVEYKLTNKNSACAKLPSKFMSKTEYLWWRLEHYFDISRRNPCFMSDSLLEDSLQISEIFFTDPFAK
jgi:hypothetical protein